MRVAWIYPKTERCGISIHARNYIDSLKNHLDILEIDTDDFCSDSHQNTQLLDSADLVHLQYESSFFLKGRNDFFFRTLSRINKPLLVSLHEVYREFPGVFARSKISGPLFLRVIRRLIYDYRHPAQTAYRKHLGKNFGADLVLVHHHYHKKILTESGADPSKIEVLALPVKISSESIPFKWTSDHEIHLGSTGFINPQFNYDLLFSILKKLDKKWRFTWIGGIRNSEQQELFNRIMSTLNQNGWDNQFRITGWVSEEEQSRFLKELDIYMALFSNRASSASLNRAIGALIPIIATQLPLTEEINSPHCSPLVVIPPECESAIDAINSILTRKGFREKLLQNVGKYAEIHSYSAMSLKLVEIYRGLSAK